MTVGDLELPDNVTTTNSLEERIAHIQIQVEADKPAEGEEADGDEASGEAGTSDDG